VEGIFPLSDYRPIFLADSHPLLRAPPPDPLPYPPPGEGGGKLVTPVTHQQGCRCCPSSVLGTLALGLGCLAAAALLSLPSRWFHPLVPAQAPGRGMQSKMDRWKRGRVGEHITTKVSKRKIIFMLIF